MRGGTLGRGTPDFDVAKHLSSNECRETLEHALQPSVSAPGERPSSHEHSAEPGAEVAIEPQSRRNGSGTDVPLAKMTVRAGITVGVAEVRGVDYPLG